MLLEAGILIATIRTSGYYCGMKVSELLQQARLMNNINALVRSIITYAVCIPLAAIIGYMLTKPLDYSAAAFYSMIVIILIFPIIARFHHPLMFLCYNLPINLFFVKTSPSIGMVMIMISLSISIFDRILSRRSQFISVPEMTVPLVILMAVVFFTAEVTGGFGLKSLGSDVYGGKKYAFLIVGIIGYFAFTARPIPPEKATLYVSMYLLGGVLSAVSDLVPLVPSGLRFIYLFIPPSGAGIDSLGNYDNLELGVSRLSGVSFAASIFYLWMLAYYGVRGIFMSGKIWRITLLAIAFLLIGLGGYRSLFMLALSVFAILFFMEKMHRSPLMFVFLLLGVVAVGLVIPFASRLPFVMQRGLSFLPLDFNQEAIASAEASSNWRITLWTDMAQQIPKYFFVGKGYAISLEDWSNIQSSANANTVGGENDSLALSSDFHNGPLSVIIPFGIWGVFAFTWIIGVAIWILYRNYRYGRPDIKRANRYLLAIFISKFLIFMTVFGALQGDIGTLLSFVGLSIALNYGVAKAGGQPLPQPAAINPPPSRLLLRPRPVLARQPQA